MILIWILFGMIITLDVIVYGLYRMIKKGPTVKKVMDIEVKIYKIEKKLTPKRKKLGRPRKPGPKKKVIRKISSP